MHGLRTVYARLLETVQKSPLFEARNGRRSLTGVPALRHSGSSAAAVSSSRSERFVFRLSSFGLAQPRFVPKTSTLAVDACARIRPTRAHRFSKCVRTHHINACARVSGKYRIRNRGPSSRSIQQSYPSSFDILYLDRFGCRNHSLTVYKSSFDVLRNQSLHCPSGIVRRKGQRSRMVALPLLWSLLSVSVARSCAGVVSRRPSGSRRASRG